MNNNFEDMYKKDLQRYGEHIDPYIKNFLFLLRKSQYSKKPMHYVWHYLLKKHRLKHGIELDSNVKIGAGLFIAHPFNITVNDKTVIGKNCNIHKGTLIGQENRGKRKGTPIIGDSVWIGINACIVGAITIGDDVLIAPNSFVNCDVPSHSIVVGNPCRIINKQHATEEYINRICND